MQFKSFSLQPIFLYDIIITILKYAVVMVGTETLLKMTLPAFIFGGVGGGIYGRITSQFNPSGNFIGI